MIFISPDRFAHLFAKLPPPGGRENRKARILTSTLAKSAPLLIVFHEFTNISIFINEKT